MMRFMGMKRISLEKSIVQSADPTIKYMIRLEFGLKLYGFLSRMRTEIRRKCVFSTRLELRTGPVTKVVPNPII